MKQILFVVALLGLLSSCVKNNVYEKNIGIEDHTWEAKNKLPFTVNIEDTTSEYNIYLIVRHTKDYAFTNLYVNFHTFFPSGKKGNQVKRIELGDNTSLSWLGECMSDICDRQVPIVEGHRFSEQGEYKFIVEQIMRTNPLENIIGIGLRVVKQP